MIGDHATDIEAGQRAGVKTIFILSGHGAKEKDNLKSQPNYSTSDLLAAVKWLLKE
jgi:phosphoglycolate phosphatase-like HAD superfamily hydrolase